MSIPELAEQMGHSPQMTVSTYTHVIRDLKGQPAKGGAGPDPSCTRIGVDAW